MDFTLSEEQRELAGLVRRIATDRLTQDRLKQVEADGVHFDRELWRALADAGVLAAALPETVGGGGLDFLELCSVLIELGRAVAPVPYLTSTVCAAALAYFGTDSQRATWAEPAASGSLVLTAALSEDLNDDPELPTTRAQRLDSGGWQLTGAKAVVPFATVADAFLLPATTADGDKLFVVLPSDSGVLLEEQRIVDGDIEATLDLAGVQLGEDRLVPGADVVHWLVARCTVGRCEYRRRGRAPDDVGGCLADRFGAAVADRDRDGEVLGGGRRPSRRAHRRARARRHRHRHRRRAAPVLRGGQAQRVRTRQRHRPAAPPRPRTRGDTRLDRPRLG